MHVTHPSRRQKKCLSSLLALLFVSVTAQAFAAEPDEAAKQQARELMARGRQAREKSDLNAALSNFKQADEIMHVPTTTLEVARTTAALGMLLEASFSLEQLEATPESADEPEVFVNARQSAKELSRELEQRIPFIRFNDIDTADAPRLTLDGRALDASELSEGVRVNPGRHVVVAEHAGKKRKRQLDVVEGATVEVSFELAATPQAAAGREAAPAAERKSAGTRPSTVAIYGLTGLAVAGVGAGIGVGLWANGRRSALENSCAPQCGDPAVTQLRSGYVAANVAAAVGAASAIAAVTIYFVRPREREAKKQLATAASLSIGASAGSDPGVTVSGSF